MQDRVLPPSKESMHLAWKEALQCGHFRPYLQGCLQLLQAATPWPLSLRGIVFLLLGEDVISPIVLYTVPMASTFFGKKWPWFFLKKLPGGIYLGGMFKNKNLSQVILYFKKSQENLSGKRSQVLVSGKLIRLLHQVNMSGN